MTEHPHSRQTIVTSWLLSQRYGAIRLLIAVIQAALLATLQISMVRHNFLASDVKIFFPLVLVSIFVPVLIISAVTHMPACRIALWTLVATATAGLIGWFQSWRLDPLSQAKLAFAFPIEESLVLAFLALGVVFFIAQVFLLSAAHDRRRIASYETYYDYSWQLVIQGVFCALFMLALTAIVKLSVSLFELCDLRAVVNVLDSPIFIIAVNSLAFAFAFHLTDLRPAVVRSIHSMVQLLLSWLLLPATILLAGFLISLPFVGLHHLRTIGHAIDTLLLILFGMVILINAAFRNGHPGYRVSHLIRHTTRLAAFLCLIVGFLAAYTIVMRIHQYGWTARRLLAVLSLIIGLVYAAGYSWAALDRTHWMRYLMPVNLITAALALCLLLLALLPILDPSIVGESSQLNRLRSGQTSAKEFDIDYFARDPSRFSRTALITARNIAGTDVSFSKKIDAVLDNPQMKNTWVEHSVNDVSSSKPIAGLRPDPELSNIRLPLKGQSLPADFRLEQIFADQDSFGDIFPDCMKDTRASCDAYLLNLHGQGDSDILLVDGENRKTLWLTHNDNGWNAAPMQSVVTTCSGFSEWMQKGAYTLESDRTPVLAIGGAKLGLTKQRGSIDCEAVDRAVGAMNDEALAHAKLTHAGIDEVLFTSPPLNNAPMAACPVITGFDQIKHLNDHKRPVETHHKKPPKTTAVRHSTRRPENPHPRYGKCVVNNH